MTDILGLGVLLVVVLRLQLIGSNEGRSALDPVAEMVASVGRRHPFCVGDGAVTPNLRVRSL